MNWTSRKPIENVKCIVETNTGCVFPAHCINGTWWNSEKAFPIDGVVRWIVYPEGEKPNDYIAPEVLLKYLMQSYREAQTRLDATRELNRKLCSTYSKTKDENVKLKEKNKELKAELKKAREQSQKLKGMFDKFSVLMNKVAGMEIPENKEDEEFVA